MNTDANKKIGFFGKLKKGLKYFYEEFIKFPAFILAHPIKGFDDFKRDNRGNGQLQLLLL